MPRKYKSPQYPSRSTVTSDVLSGEQDNMAKNTTLPGLSPASEGTISSSVLPGNASSSLPRHTQYSSLSDGSVESVPSAPFLGGEEVPSSTRPSGAIRNTLPVSRLVRQAGASVDGNNREYSEVLSVYDPDRDNADRVFPWYLPGSDEVGARPAAPQMEVNDTDSQLTFIDDQAGTVDGLNLFRMVRNNPGTLRDMWGIAPDDIEKKQDIAARVIQRHARSAMHRWKQGKLADTAAKRTSSKTSLIHVFFRGDSRPPKEIFNSGFRLKENEKEKGVSISPHFEPAAAYPWDAAMGNTYVYVMLIDTKIFSYPFDKDIHIYRSALWSRDAILRDIFEEKKGLSASEQSGSLFADSPMGLSINTITNPVEIRHPVSIEASNIFGAFTVKREWQIPGETLGGGGYSITGFEESDHHKLDEGEYLTYLSALDSYVQQRWDQMAGRKGKITMGTPVRNGWHSVQRNS